MGNRLIYADNSATTPIHAEVLTRMMPYLTTCYGNPSSAHTPGRDSRKAIEQARSEVAALMNAKPEEILFTGCGSEADNLALRGCLSAGKAAGKKHLIVSAAEHPAVLQTALALEREGYRLTVLPVDEYGRVDPAAVAQAICPDTALVSVIFANNEIGTINPIAEIGRICREKGVLFHTDAVQAYGRVPVDVREMCIDLLSLSGHKLNAPKGVGALFVREGVQIDPILTGGGQEQGLRPGTENVAYLVALGEAARLKQKNCAREAMYLGYLADVLTEGMLSIPGAVQTGDPENRLPGHCSFCISGVDGGELVRRLDEDGICISAGSACHAGCFRPSAVLLAIGMDPELARGAIRITLGAQNTEEDVDAILAALRRACAALRGA